MTTDRRASPRHATRGRLFQAVAPDGTILAFGVIDDISAAGVRLLTARPCPAGPAVLVPMPPHPLAGQEFAFRVERAVALAGGCALIAGPFTPPLTDAEARALAEAP